MTTSTIVNSTGLLLDILGAILIWRYGIPNPLSRKGEIFMITEDTDEKEAAKAKSYDRKAQFGILLLIVGFALQLFSNLV